MIVSELIKILQSMPQEAEVVICDYSIDNDDDGTYPVNIELYRWVDWWVNDKIECVFA